MTVNKSDQNILNLPFYVSIFDINTLIVLITEESIGIHSFYW